MSDELDDIDEGDEVDVNIGIEIGQFDVKAHEILPKMYLAYALSVIKERALPDICDGLKPVARRILYTMHEMGLTNNKVTKKSANVVGTVMAKYHPHGESYGAAVRLVQPFTTRYPLIFGQGNFGSLEDPPAAHRYTEMKLAKISDDVILADLDKDTVDFMPNYDGTLQEPKVLPTKVPLFLINGSLGIAVGMATSTPPHNLTEVVDALIAYIANEDITVQELMQYIKGPDFPSGAYMFKTNLAQIYETGRGSVTLRAKAEIDEKGKKHRIIITELPYQLDRENLITRIAELYQSKEEKLEGIDGIADLRDESDKTGTRIVIELRKGVQASMVLNTLYRRTELQCKHAIYMRALVNNMPRMVGLKEIFKHFLIHRKDIVIRRAEFELRKNKERCHILEGFLIVFDNLDQILIDVKTSSSTEETYTKLRKYGLDDIQIKAILDLRIQKLAQFERDTIVNDHIEIAKIIKKLTEFLESEDLIIKQIKDELIDIKTRFGDERKTKILDIDENEKNIDDIEEIQEEDVVITVTHNGLVKRTPVTEYKLQNVKGRGLIGVDIKDEDYVESIFQLSTRSYTLVFTNKGLCYKMNAYDIPSLGRTAAGSSILNILKLNENEKVVRVIPISDLTGKHFIIVTKNGQVKKLKAEKLQRPRSTGTMIIGLENDDSLVDVKLLDHDVDLLLVTRGGMSIRFPSSSVRAAGKHSIGIRGIKLSDNDCIVSSNLIKIESSCLIVVTERGYSKKTVLTKFRTQNRGGCGIICMNVNIVTGKIISANVIENEDEQFIVITQKGILIRLRINQIHKLGRNTQGCKIQKLKDDSIAAVAYIGVVTDEKMLEGIQESDVDDAVIESKDED